MMKSIQRFIDDSYAFAMAGVMLAPCMAFMYAVHTVDIVVDSSKTAFIAPVYASESGTSRASASIYTVVNGEVVTDVHKEVSSTDGSSVSVSVDGQAGSDGEDGADGADGADGEDGKDGNVIIETRTEARTDAAADSRLEALIRYLQHLLSLLRG